MKPEQEWVLVPAEPTREMLLSVDGEADDKYVARGRAYSAWKSMLASRPAVPAQVGLQNDFALIRAVLDGKTSSRGCADALDSLENIENALRQLSGGKKE